VSWSYSGKRLGPRNWANLSPKFATCATGTAQSPINIVEVVDKVELPSLRTERLYASRVSLYNSGRGAMVAVLPRNYNGMIDIGGRALKVHKVRFHAQSEHQIRGTAFPLEMQIVARSTSGTVVIVSVLFMMGEENPVLAKVWDEFEAVKGVVKSKGSLDLGLLLRSLAHGGYYTYQGSLPYPPCFEGVEWIVMRSPLTVSKRQIKYFTFRANGKNWRDIMPKNGRTVYASARDPPENLPPSAESGEPPRF
jgi:carbonic anhydrase